MRYYIVFILFITVCMSGTAQDNLSSIETTAYRRVIVYAGPGITYPELTFLNAGIPATIIERNTTGTWVRVQRYDNDETVMDGWIVSGFLNLPPELNYADIPENRELADADSETVTSESMSELYEMPIIPTISDAMVDVFQRGQMVGNHANSITKVGDSLSASEQFISIFNEENHILGPYAYLEPTLNFYAESTGNDNLASRIGMTSYTVRDSMWATDERCESGETPLDCEYRVHQPAIAFIIFCGNDVRHMTDEEYDEQIRLIVDETLEAGVIPVLFTCSTHPDEDFFWQSINFNLRLKTIAEEYEIPAINLWTAARHLPEFGLDEDLIHLRHSGFNYLKYDAGQEAYSGLSLQNLLVLRTLHEIRLTLESG